MQKDVEMLNEFPEKLVIRPFRVVKRITFMFEDAQQSFDVAVVPMQRLNDRAIVRPRLRPARTF